MKKTKDMKGDFALATILVVLLVMRLIYSEDAFSKNGFFALIISIINYAGAGMAFLSTFKDIIACLRVKWQNILSKIWLLLFVLIIAFGTYCGANSIVFPAKANDCITILALLFSVPNDFYIAWIKEKFPKNDVVYSKNNK